MQLGAFNLITEPSAVARDPQGNWALDIFPNYRPNCLRDPALPRWVLCLTAFQP